MFLSALLIVGVVAIFGGLKNSLGCGLALACPLFMIGMIMEKGLAFLIVLMMPIWLTYIITEIFNISADDSTKITLIIAASTLLSWCMLSHV